MRPNRPPDLDHERLDLLADDCATTNCYDARVCEIPVFNSPENSAPCSSEAEPLPIGGYSRILRNISESEVKLPQQKLRRLRHIQSALWVCIRVVREARRTLVIVFSLDLTSNCNASK